MLLRRVYLDLIGLPPTREELHDFLADPSDAAYERVVDRLLASPQYGERWARHWMDVWRYSDWYGRRAVPDVLNSYAMIWRWRDWIVRSLNDDNGYDRMVRRDARGRRAGAGRRGEPRRHRVPRPQLLPVELQLLDEGQRRAHRQGVPRPDHSTAPTATTTSTTRSRRRTTSPSAPSSSRSRSATTACPASPTRGPIPKYDYGKAYGPITSGMVRVFDEKLDAKTFLYTRGESRNIVPGRPPDPAGSPGVPGRWVLPRRAGRRCPPEASYPGLKEFVRREELQKCAADVARCAQAVSRIAKEASLEDAQVERGRTGPRLRRARGDSRHGSPPTRSGSTSSPATRRP